jgi:hypothetical protein
MTNASGLKVIERAPLRSSHRSMNLQRARSFPKQLLRAKRADASASLRCSFIGEGSAVRKAQDSSNGSSIAQWFGKWAASRLIGVVEAFLESYAQADETLLCLRCEFILSEEPIWFCLLCADYPLCENCHQRHGCPETDVEVISSSEFGSSSAASGRAFGRARRKARVTSRTARHIGAPG